MSFTLFASRHSLFMYLLQSCKKSADINLCTPLQSYQRSQKSAKQLVDGRKSMYLGRVHEDRGADVALLVVLLLEDRAVVENGREHVDRGHGDEEEEGRLDERALIHGLAVEDARAEWQQDGRARAVHQRLVEQQALRPPAAQQKF